MTAPPILQQARALQMEGKIDEAAAAYEQYLAENPDDVRTMDLLGQMFAAAERIGDAEVVYRRAMQIDERNDMICFRFAMLQAGAGHKAEAIDLFRRALEIRPGRLQPLRHLGALCFELGRFDEALPVMREIVELRPRAADAHTNLARTLLALRAFDEAEAAALTATELRDSSVDAWITLGLARMEQGNFEGAEAGLRSAAAVAPGDPRPQTHLARLFERWRRFEDATRAAEAAVAIAPAIGARRVLGRLHMHVGNPEAALEVQSDMLADNPGEEERGHVLIEQGRTLDRLGRHEEAMNAFLSGQALLAPPQSAVHEQIASFMAMLERCRDWPESPVNWPGDPASGARPAPVFLVGFPRSGTTLTEQLLGAHPDFVTSDELPLLHVVVQEVSRRGPYPQAVGDLSEADVAALCDSYWNEAKRFLPTLRATGTRLVDKQPYNTPHLAVIRRLFPDARVVVVLRDPRDACLSLLMQDVAPGQRMISYPTLETAAATYERMMGGYLRQRDHLGLACHEVRYEDLIADLEAHARRLIDFVGSSWTDEVLTWQEHAATRRSQINTHAVASGVYTRSRERWRRYASAIAPIQEQLRPFVEAFGYEAE